MNAWVDTLTTITGTSDRHLASGLYGYQLAVAKETLRDYPSWKTSAQATFRQMLLTVFAPMNTDFLLHHNGTRIDHYWASWNLANTASLMAIGKDPDRRDLYLQAPDSYLNGDEAVLHAAWTLHPGNLAQWQNSGRNQSHTLLGLGLAGTICEIALHQGDDLFAANGNRPLAAACYVTRYNFGQDVPYTPYTDSDVTRPVMSPVGRGELRPIWSLLYRQYIVERGLDAPELQAAAAQAGVDGGGDYGPNSGGYDQLGYGSLTFTRP